MKSFARCFLASPPFLLAAIAALAYGILAPQLGFYWDDLPIGWIRYQLGVETLTRYFSTNRPALGILYQSLTSFLPYKPIYWQILALSLRWLSGVLVWLILRKIFPRQKKLPLAAALLFLLYPGFDQQFVSFVYSSHFFALIFFLFSVFAMLQSFKRARFSWVWTMLGMLCSAANLLLGEYFFLLDLIRIPILWVSFSPARGGDARQGRGGEVRRVFLACFPYLIIFLAAIIGRAFFLANETYEYSLLAELKSAPLLALWVLIKTILLSLYTTLIAAWGQAFMPPDFELQGRVTIAIYLGVIFISFAATLFAFYKKNNTVSERSGAQTKSGSSGNYSSSTGPSAIAFRSETGESVTLITLGIFAALLAGIPFWLTNLPVSLGFPANRATLPFMLGSVFFLVGVITLIPRKNLQTLLLTIIVAFSAGRQFLWADEFRRDWNVHRNLFWQMSWRIPAIEEDTVILLNEGALKFYADNSLSAPLNWIYAPDANEDHIPYMLFYPRTRFGVDGEKLEADMSLQHNFIAGEFNGNTSQMVLVNFSPPGCLHIVDPELDSENRFISDLLLRDAAPFSRPELILPFGEPQLPDIYAPEPVHGWCYYFQKADLARQRGDWDQVVALGEQAFGSGDHPNDPTENFVFVEGYAFAGNWAQAEQLSLRTNRVSPSYLNPLLCRLWERIDRETSDGSEKMESVVKMKTKFGCE